MLKLHKVCHGARRSLQEMGCEHPSPATCPDSEKFLPFCGSSAHVQNRAKTFRYNFVRSRKHWQEEMSSCRPSLAQAGSGCARVRKGSWPRNVEEKRKLSKWDILPGKTIAFCSVVLEGASARKKGITVLLGDVLSQPIEA